MTTACHSGYRTGTSPVEDIEHALAATRLAPVAGAVRAAAHAVGLDDGRRKKVDVIPLAPLDVLAPFDVPMLRLDPELPAPGYARPDDAGADLRTAVEVILAPGERRTVPTGVALALPPGYAGFVHPRSGLAARHGLTVVNAPGTIDAGYRGEILVTLLNTDADQPLELRRGDRIAQLVVQRVEHVRFVEVGELPASVRGADGFGSTGGFGEGPAMLRVDVAGAVTPGRGELE